MLLHWPIVPALDQLCTFLYQDDKNLVEPDTIIKTWLCTYLLSLFTIISKLHWTGLYNKSKQRQGKLYLNERGNNDDENHVQAEQLTPYFLVLFSLLFWSLLVKISLAHWAFTAQIDIFAHLGGSSTPNWFFIFVATPTLHQHATEAMLRASVIPSVFCYTPCSWEGNIIFENLIKCGNYVLGSTCDVWRVTNWGHGGSQNDWKSQFHSWFWITGGLIGALI